MTETSITFLPHYKRKYPFTLKDTDADHPNNLFFNLELFLKKMDVKKSLSRKHTATSECR